MFLLGSQNYFTINANSGEITTTSEKLDREAQTSYAFQVTATDPDGRIVRQKFSNYIVFFRLTKMLGQVTTNVGSQAILVSHCA